MERKNIFWAIAAVVVIVLALGAWFYFGRNNNNQQASPSPESSLPPLTINFSETGNLSKQKNELDEDAWFLVYEKPGQPGLKAELIFDEESICEINGQKVDCLAGNFNAGERVKVEGMTEEGLVLVASLKTPSSSAETPLATGASVGSVGLANPASEYCLTQGGTLEMRTDEQGGQYGVCQFSNGRECEEWKFFQGECAK